MHLTSASPRLCVRNGLTRSRNDAKRTWDALHCRAFRVIRAMRGQEGGGGSTTNDADAHGSWKGYGATVHDRFMYRQSALFRACW